MRCDGSWHGEALVYGLYGAISLLLNCCINQGVLLVIHGVDACKSLQYCFYWENDVCHLWPFRLFGKQHYLGSLFGHSWCSKIACQLQLWVIYCVCWWDLPLGMGRMSTPARYLLPLLWHVATLVWGVVCCISMSGPEFGVKHYPETWCHHDLSPKAGQYIMGCK